MMTRKVIRVHKQDSAFVYSILESLEGWVGVSTLKFEHHDAYRDLELNIPLTFISDIETVIQGFRKKFPVIELGQKQHE